METGTPSPRRRRPLLVVALIVVAIAAGTGWYLAQAPKRARDAAMLDARAGKFADAQPILEQWLANHPDDAEATEWLARAHLARKEDEAALPLLDRAILARPTERELRRLRFDLHRRLKNRELAYADGQALFERSPADLELRRALMGLAISLARFAEAEEHASALLVDSPKDRSLRLMMGEIKRNRGDEEGALAAYRQLVAEDGSDYGARLALGTLLHGMGKSEEAVTHLQLVFDNDPSRRRTCGQQLGMALAKVGKQAEADQVLAEMRRLQDTEIIRAAIQNRPDDLDLHVRLAESLLADGHVDDGMKLLLQVIERQPRHSAAHRAVANQYDKQGDAANAAKHRRLAYPSP